MFRYKKKILQSLLFFLVIVGTSIIFAAYQPVNPQHDDPAKQHENDTSRAWEIVVAKEEFNAGKNIIGHIIDSHEWHLWTYKGHHVNIPLPVILIYEGKLYTFWSSKFHHGKDSYKGFHIETEGEYKGKIIKDPEFDYLDEEIVHIEKEAVKKEVALPIDLSITKNVAAIFISIIILLWIFISVAGSYRKRKGKAPKGMQSLVEPLIIFIRDDIAKAAIGEKKYERYLPFLLTLFFFIFLNNLLGLVPFFPGGANVTGNVSVTGVLAVFTFVILILGANKHYWKHIYNTPGVPIWLKLPIPIMPLVEFLGILTKPFVLMVRLFANITAGHIIILGFISLIFIFGNIHPAIGYGASLISVPFAIFMGLLELLVAFIQAYVFTLLSALYFGMAIEEHH
ncbi:MAG: F0F1 ATP synthase subunit A [Bacteroidota bacterium]|nr:F0F1 ATP synthase subunit A [Bacteroidota bacterium]